MVTGWQTIDGLLYYFDASGAMAAGWTKLDGYWYYFNNEGKLMTGWMQLDGKFYYLHTDGRMVIGWQSDGTNKYYMDTVSGVMELKDIQADELSLSTISAKITCTGAASNSCRSSSSNQPPAIFSRREANSPLRRNSFFNSNPIPAMVTPSDIP